jgi:uncharacterized membrane protein YdcZ (DUF606 family)
MLEPQLSPSSPIWAIIGGVAAFFIIWATVPKKLAALTTTLFVVDN